MSERLPVGEVLNEAFQFGLKRWTSVLKYGWLPAVLAAGVMFGYVSIVFDLSALQTAESDPTVFLRFGDLLKAPPSLAIALGVVCLLIVMYLFSGFMASVYRLVALGEEREGVFQLRVNGPAMRVFWAQIILAVINFGVWWFAFVIAASMSGTTPGAALGAGAEAFSALMAAAQANTTLSPDQMAALAEPLSVFFLAGLLALIPLIYLGIKLVPFPAGSAAENRLLLFGAFRMTAGHFWSILWAYVLLVVFLLILGIVFSIATEVLGLLALLQSEGGGLLAIIALAAMVIQLALTIIYQAFVYGVQFAMQAIVYRRLRTGE